MKKIILLSSDTLHHRYFINRLKKDGHKFAEIIFETSHVEPPFETGPFFSNEENDYEETSFFKDVEKDISQEKITEFNNVNSSEAVEYIKSLKPDLGIVFGTRKLSNELVSVFSDGLVNVHRGIAQKYRGLDSDLWAIYHRDLQNIGVTLHMVESQLDTGGVVYQERTHIPSESKIYHLRYLTTLTATLLCSKVLKDYKQGKLKAIPQNEKGRYYSFMPLVLKKTLIRKFNKLLDGK